MKVLILGGDGYLGWPTAMYLSKKGHDVAVLDNYIKRFWESQAEVEPLTPVNNLNKRIKIWENLTQNKIKLFLGDISENSRFLNNTISDFKPEAIIHYAEQPSAPFSMISQHNCIETQRNNVLGTLNLIFAIQRNNPDIHIIKLGTMGEYGTPNIDIEEGWLKINHNGRSDKVLYPKRPPSFYHLSKVHDSANLEFVCRSWDFRVTDLNQGIVYGIETDETIIDDRLCTSFHYDQYFGTVLNRFIVQAYLGIPLTVYGKGGQTRGMLNIKDTLKCVEIALNNPASKGEFRVFNQFTEQFTVLELAKKVKKACIMIGKEVDIGLYPNPRKELDNHYFNAKHSALVDLGLEPEYLNEDFIIKMINTVSKYSERIDPSIIEPTHFWNNKSAR